MWFSTTQKSAGSQARTLVNEGAVLVDVRTPEEYAAGHVHGARNIPLNELPARVGELGGAKKLVVYCRSGGRSAAATQLLRKAGYDVLDIGGMHNW